MIRYLRETGSTNADVIAAMRAGERVAEGAWLVADRQTTGRGRQGRQWFGGAGNFMGSTVVHPAQRDPPAPSLALMAALAVYEAVLPLLGDPHALMLKWPNDILLAGAKLAGILLERERGAVVIGVGVNLAAAPDLPERATVALAQFAPPPARDAFAQALAASFDNELERWRTFGLEPVLRRWQLVAHPVGTRLAVHGDDRGLVSGSFAGLADDGALLLRLEDGAIRPIHAGDVTLG